MIVNSVKAIFNARERSEIVVLADKQVDELRLRNIDLTAQLENVCSDSYVEREARNRLLYGKDGEILVVLPETGVAEVSAMDIDENNVIDDASSTVNGWKRWWDLLLHGV